MVTLDKIRLTGLLRKKPWKQGFFYSLTVAGRSALRVISPAALARGRRPETWDLERALAEDAPSQTPAATAANLGFVVAHAAGREAVAAAGDEAAYADGFAAERAWQLAWWVERLALATG
jgi:hypothetical protein